ncbi:MAG: 16S rRNA (uracil(1498)-N(3))-methyltransferase [Bacillota bacterium]|nr:16S rRNA (uracil(1498)-N(3))-methyltransferase [Bacillota bacterium]
MGSFFVEPQHIKDGKVYITGQDAKHLSKVLRIDAGDSVKVFDGSGMEYLVKLLSVKPSEATGQIIEQKSSITEPPIRVNLVQGLPKQGKMELIIQKTTELGITGIFPVETERSVVRIDKNKAEDKRDRWQKIAVEAVKQCGRGRIPTVYTPTTLKAFLDKLDPNNNNLLIMPWEEEASQGLKAVLTEYEQVRFSDIFILIGPEGGFSQQEINEVHQLGGKIVTLGPRILRTETAGLAILSAIMYHLGDLGG